MMDAETSGGCHLYHEEVGDGAPILLIHPSGSTASTWGPAIEELARVGRVITYDRRGYARSGGEPVRALSIHTADAAALLESLQAPPALVVGTSSGAMIALDLAVRRPDLVRAVVEHEGPWRFTRHLPSGSQIRTFATMGSLVLRGRHSDAAEALLRSAYGYREGGTAWDAFPEEWRRVGRENGKATLWDFLIDRQPSIGEGTREHPGPGRVQLRLTEPRLHGPPHPFARLRHPRRENALHRGGGSRSLLRRTGPLRAAGRRRHHGSRRRFKQEVR